MRPIDQSRATKLSSRLVDYSTTVRILPGIENELQKGVLIEQLVESLRRIEFVSVIQERDISADRGDPTKRSFDPLRAAILKWRAGDPDEAFWLVYLAIHCGKHKKDGWRLTRALYGALGNAEPWTWARVCNQVDGFCEWLAANEDTLRGGDGISRKFGDHRRYQSIKAYTPNGTGVAVKSYINWIEPPQTHLQKIQKLSTENGQNPKTLFAAMYDDMARVKQFGRLGRFDYLAMLGKLGLAPIIPGSTFLKGATGPIPGAKLLFTGNVNTNISVGDLDKWLCELDSDLEVGMQALEDALCNWQKSPRRFIPFR